MSQRESKPGQPGAENDEEPKASGEAQPTLPPLPPIPGARPQPPSEGATVQLVTGAGAPAAGTPAAGTPAASQATQPVQAAPLMEGATVRTPVRPAVGDVGEGATIRTGPVPTADSSQAAPPHPGPSTPAGHPQTSVHPTAQPSHSGGTGAPPATGWDQSSVSKPFSQPSAAGTGLSQGPLAVDSIVAGRYRVLKVLGVGGMGEVYLVRDEALEIEVALKVMRSEVAADASFLQRFRNELLVARQITHPHVVRIHDLGQDGPLLFMTMDYVEGRSLEDLMKSEGAMAHARATEIVRQVADALAVAHRKGVVHRDLKPANILLDAKGDAFVTDFGIARSHSFSGLTRTGEVLGTPDYLAPEQARGQEVDGRTDIYALGLIFFEMVSGQRPFVGGTLYEILAQHMNGQTRTFKELGVPIEPGLEAVISRCLAPMPEERYATAEELVQDLDDFERPKKRREQERLRRRLRKLGKGAAQLAAAVLVVVGVWWAWQALKPEPPPPASMEPAVAEEKAIPELPSVLILPLAVDASASESLKAWASVGYPDLLERALVDGGGFRAVSGERVRRVIRDLELSLGSLSDADIGFLADLFQAERVVSGRLSADDAAGEVSWALSIGSGGDEGASPVEGTAPSGDPPRLLKEALPTLASTLGLTELELPASSAAPSALTDYYLGLKALDDEDPEAAGAALDRALELDGALGPAWLEKAELELALGRPGDAARSAEQAVAAIPADAPETSRFAYRARSLVADLGDRGEEAQAELEALMERWPGDTEARFEVALRYGNQGRLEDAVDQLEILRRMDPTDSRVWYYLGRYTIVGGDPERAVDDYLVDALSRARRDGNAAGEAQILNALGIGYRHLGKVEQASRRYADAAELQQRLGNRDGYAKAQMNLGDLSIELGRLDEAEQQLNQALETFEELGNVSAQANVVNALGVLRERQGRYDDALDQYRQALRLRLEAGDRLAAAESYYNVGFAYLEMANYTDAGLNLEQALGIYNELGNSYGAMLVLQSRASAAIAQGEWQAAERDLLDALATSRELQIPLASAVSHGDLGRLAALRGNYRDAFSGFQKGLEIVEQQDHLQGRVEITLTQAEGLLSLGAVEAADELLSQVETWVGDTGSGTQKSKLGRLQGLSDELKGDGARAAERYAQAVADAEASHSTATLLAARLAAAGLEPSTLQDVLTEARRLGHVPLELQASEALVRGLMQADRAAESEEPLRRAMNLVRKLGDYAGAHRLLALQANVDRARGREDAAKRSGQAAGEELDRLRAQIPEEHRETFDAAVVAERAKPATPG